MYNINSMLEYTRELNVLYVEDTLEMREYIQELLSSYFKSVDLAHDGIDALQKYKKYKQSTKEYYDLIITDINMPKLNGIEMSEEMRELHSSQKIVITTGYNNIEYLERALDIGIDSFVTKPIRKNQFLQILAKVSQVIVEHKFVLSHMNEMQELNLTLKSMNDQLELQNIELFQKNSELEKSFRMLDTMVEKEQLTYREDIPDPPNLKEEKFIQEQVELLINDDLYELIDIHATIDVNIIHILNEPSNVDSNILKSLSDLFSKYSSILAYYNFFDDLSTVMVNFSNVMKDEPLPQNEEAVQNIFMLVESFTYILGKWQSDLVNLDISKLNSLDASMMSDMETIINMWTQKEVEVTDSEMDDIFDF